jgi:sugar-specific transcriptional regulator TrmB
VSSDRQKLVNELTYFGLTTNEAKIYLALLQLRQGTARSISKVAEIPRQEIYRVVPKLMKRGLIETTATKPEHFIAVPPSKVLTQLVAYMKEDATSKITVLEQKTKDLQSELEKVEGKSFGFSAPPPVHYVCISGDRLINERIGDMLDRSKREVLWVSPKLEIRKAVVYDRDEMLRKCARRGVKVRILTEVSEDNIEETKKLAKFAEIRHVSNLSSLMTIIDDKEIMMGSAVRSGYDDLIHELWTDDQQQVSTMREFFEKVWNEADPGRTKL